jgi:GDP-L-fucose synthase
MRALITGTNGPLGYALNSLMTSDYNSDFTNSSILDLRDKRNVIDYMAMTKPDVVIHLAAKSGGAALNSTEPVQMFEDNMNMTMNILAGAVNSGVKRVILASSTSAYPSKRVDPAHEEQLHNGAPNDSDYPYAYAKRMMEPLARAYSSQYGINVCVAIVNGIVGPKMNFKLGKSVMLAALIRRFYETSLIPDSEQDYYVFGDGSPIREYTYSFDLAKALLWLVESENLPRIINIGSSASYSIREYAEFVLESLSLDKSKLRFTEPIGSSLNTYNQTTDNSLFLESSKFEFTDIKASIAETLDWLKSNYQEVIRCD